MDKTASDKCDLIVQPFYIKEDDGNLKESLQRLYPALIKTLKKLIFNSYVQGNY
jgi:hypothetical protein